MIWMNVTSSPPENNSDVSRDSPFSQLILLGLSIQVAKELHRPVIDNQYCRCLAAPKYPASIYPAVPTVTGGPSTTESDSLPYNRF